MYNVRAKAAPLLCYMPVKTCSTKKKQYTDKIKTFYSLNDTSEATIKDKNPVTFRDFFKAKCDD